MSSTVIMLKLWHRIFLLSLLLCFAVIPFCYSTTSTTVYVFMPMLFIAISFLSVSLENSLNRLNEMLVSKQESKCKRKDCILIKALNN